MGGGIESATFFAGKIGEEVITKNRFVRICIWCSRLSRKREISFESGKYGLLRGGKRKDQWLLTKEKCKFKDMRYRKGREWGVEF